MSEAFHYLVVQGADGGVERAPGEAIGLDLATMLSEGLPPVSAVLMIISALAELLSILEEDGLPHGALDLECIFFDETGAIGVEGFQPGAEEGVDRYALGRIGLELFSGTPFSSPGEPAHEDAVLDAILATDLNGIDGAIVGDVQWFIARLLDLDPYHRPAPVQVWRSFIAFASATPGPEWAAWSAQAMAGGGERRGHIPEPRATGPATRYGEAFLSKDALRTASTTPPAPGGGNATTYWTNEELDAMAAELETAPKPRRCDGVAEKRQQTLLRLGSKRKVSRQHPDEISIHGVISSPTANTVFQEGTEAASEERRQFSIEQCLGRGGFGEVYLCTMSSAGGMRSKVAVKVLREGVDPRAQAVRRLRDEARVLGSLQHPAILNALDLVVLAERVAMVTEYIPGADLDVCLEGDDPPSLRALLSVLAVTAEALDASWNAVVDGKPLRLVHRDIKPSNIRIGTHGQVKVLDFGIAKFASTREAKTQNNQMIGTLSYMAPERLASADDQSAGDVYAIGAILFEALAGYGLWSETTPRQQYMLSMVDTEHDGHVLTRVDQIQTLPEVREILRHTLSFDPDARPTAGELAQTLEDLSDETPGRNLRRWARDHTWPTPAAFDAELVGRTISEGRSMGRTSGTMPGTTDVTTLPRPEPVRPPPPADVGSTTNWDVPVPEPVFEARPDPVAPAPPPPPPAVKTIAPVAPDEPEPTGVLSLPIDEPYDADPYDSDEWAPPPRSKALPILLALGLGLLLFVLTLGGSVATGLALFSGEESSTNSGTVEPGPSPQPVEPGQPIEPAPGVEPGSVEPVGPAQPGQPIEPGQPVEPGAPMPAPSPTTPRPNTDGVAAVQPGPVPGPIDGLTTEPQPSEPQPSELQPEPGLPAPGPVPGTAPTEACGDLIAMEPSAAAGRLNDTQRSCLTLATQNTALKMTDRQKHGRLLLADAKASCDSGKACPGYESAQDRYFAELGRSDANLMYAYATHLYDSAGGNLARGKKASLWAGRALERKGAWTGRVHTQRTLMLKKIRARVAHDVYVASPTEANRGLVRDRSVDWAEQRLRLNLDATAAFAMCASATGSMESCDKRVTTEAATEEVTLLSVPPRAQVFVDGKDVGTTPKRIPLTYGSHEVEMRFDGEKSKKSIRVGGGQPVRWQWFQADDAWKSSL